MVNILKVLEVRLVNVTGTAKVQFIRIDPEDLNATLSQILNILMDLSWLKNFDQDYLIQSYTNRANKTIDDIKKKFDDCDTDKLTSDAGEYVVSVLAKDTLTTELSYTNIPLGELLGKKTSGNPGFDFHSQNPLTNTVIFGEAKYVATQSAYHSALTQIEKFIVAKKDIDDLADLRDFCTPSALSRASKGLKGFAAAFSVKSTSSDRLIELIQKQSDFKKLLSYEEIILVAVNL